MDFPLNLKRLEVTASFGSTAKPFSTYKEATCPRSRKRTSFNASSAREQRGCLTRQIVAPDRRLACFLALQLFNGCYWIVRVTSTGPYAGARDRVSREPSRERAIRRSAPVPGTGLEIFPKLPQARNPIWSYNRPGYRSYPVAGDSCSKNCWES
jgi:hypothetical protein